MLIVNTVGSLLMGFVLCFCPGLQFFLGESEAPFEWRSKDPATILALKGGVDDARLFKAEQELVRAKR